VEYSNCIGFHVVEMMHACKLSTRNSPMEAIISCSKLGRSWELFLHELIVVSSPRPDAESDTVAI
jgi:hypothetical protein